MSELRTENQLPSLLFRLLPFELLATGDGPRLGQRAPIEPPAVHELLVVEKLTSTPATGCVRSSQRMCEPPFPVNSNNTSTGTRFRASGFGALNVSAF